jgi:hypothetical protein
MVPEPGDTSTTATNALIHTGLLSVGLSNLFWKGSELDPSDPDMVLLVALAVFCLALPFQALYILLSRMIREYGSTGTVVVPDSILLLASRCEMVSYTAGASGFSLMLIRTSKVLGGTLIVSTLLVLLLARSAMIQSDQMT